MELNTGMNAEGFDKVTEEKTALSWGSGDLMVYATPAMLLLMEHVSKDLVKEGLKEGETTVGTLLHVEHISASPVGSDITCKSELIEIDRKRLVFQVEAYDQSGLIGKGTHERYIVATERFMEKANGKLSLQ